MAIRMETRNAVAWTTIDRPEVLNSLDIAHLEQLHAIFRQAGEDEANAVLVLTGVGRFAIELVRRNPDVVGGLSNAQLVAIACVGGGAFFWLRARLSPKSA